MHDPVYSQYLANLQSDFNSLVSQPNVRLFTTDTTGLFDAYLAAFPEAERQFHNCNSCRKFFERFGGLVLVDDVGQTATAVWGRAMPPSEYVAAISAVVHLVHSRPVTGVFYSSDKTWGTPTTGKWSHFALRAPAHLVTAVATKTTDGPYDLIAKKREGRATLLNHVARYSNELLDTATLLLGSDEAYRGEGGIKHLAFLKQVKAAVGNDNLIWKLVADAPNGYLAPDNTTLGSLLQDLIAGTDYETALSAFAVKMDPNNRMRSKSAPTAGALRVAEQKFAELGLAPALKRRYAGPDDLVVSWRSPTARAAAPAPAGGLFSHIAPKAPSAPAPTPGTVPATTMTWDKFARTVLPTASAIEALVPRTADRFMALVTAADPTAPNLLAWGNSVSWYYAAGVDGEIKRRVEAAGGQYENVDVRASLIWENRNDLDLFVFTPHGEHIYFGDKRSMCGGHLDVDRNVGGETTTPVENTRWARGTARPGTYRVQVWNYNHHEPKRADVPFRLELQAGGQTFTVEGVVPVHSIRIPQDVVSFTLGADGKLVGQPTFDSSVTSAASAPAAWNVTPGEFVPVTAVVPSPNTWGQAAPAHGGEHVFFTLEGCRDTQQGVGRGFFVEQLRADLYDVRKVMEAYAATAAIEPAPGDAPACGLGFSTGTAWDLTLRVRTALGTQLYKIDRWD